MILYFFIWCYTAAKVPKKKKKKLPGCMPQMIRNNLMWFFWLYGVFTVWLETLINPVSRSSWQPFPANMVCNIHCTLPLVYSTSETSGFTLEFKGFLLYFMVLDTVEQYWRHHNYVITHMGLCSVKQKCDVLYNMF